MLVFPFFMVFYVSPLIFSLVCPLLFIDVVFFCRFFIVFFLLLLFGSSKEKEEEKERKMHGRKMGKEERHKKKNKRNRRREIKKVKQEKWNTKKKKHNKEQKTKEEKKQTFCCFCCFVLLASLWAKPCQEQGQKTLWNKGFVVFLFICWGALGETNNRRKPKNRRTGRVNKEPQTDEKRALVKRASKKVRKWDFSKTFWTSENPYFLAFWPLRFASGSFVILHGLLISRVFAHFGAPYQPISMYIVLHTMFLIKWKCNQWYTMSIHITNNILVWYH